MTMKVLFAVALMLGSATVALAQEKDDVSVRSLAASLELELGVTDRLQFRAEMPVSALPAEGLEIGFVYELWRRDRVVFGAGLDFSPARPV